ncbi:MAG: HAD-IA family hydrolase [Pseudomonadota bacterium]
MNSRHFDLLIFDWDGTLMDSTGAIAESIQMACADLGMRVPHREEAKQIIGLGLAEALQTLLPELTPDEYPGLVERYRHYFHGQDHSLPLFDGVANSIAALHADDYWLAVATGKSRNGLERAFDQSGLRKFFHVSRCADEGYSKPHPGMVLELMDYCGVEAERTLMIGDTSHDLQMALNAGVASVGVAYGAHSVASLQVCQPLYIAEDFQDLMTWLNNYA